MKFWNFIKNEETGEVELRIDGEIISDEDVWLYEYFEIEHASPNKFREELSKYTGENITVWIDSIGGDVFAASGIYNALMEHKGEITVKIDGRAFSAASIIAMAGTEVLMGPASAMWPHNPWTSAVGEAKDMRYVADLLDEIKEGIMNVYELKTGRPRDEISALMDKDEPMNATKAIGEKFADGMLYAETYEAAMVHYANTYRPLILNSVKRSISRASEFKEALRAKKKQAEESSKPEKTPVIGRVFDKRVKVREILHRRYQKHG